MAKVKKMARNKFLSEFRTFLERGSAIDMAVGIIVGSVMTTMVNSLVKDVIMPPIGMLIGDIDFSQFFIVLSGGAPGAHYNTVAEAQAAGAATMNIGVFLNTVVSFLITMFAVFLMVRVMNKLRAKKAVTTRTCPYCKSTINIQATKCPNCCSKLQAEQIIPAQPSDLEKGIKTVTRVARDKITKITKVAHGGRKSR